MRNDINEDKLAVYAVELIVRQGISPAEVSKHLNVHPTKVYKWLRRMEIAFPKPSRPSSDDVEIRQFKRMRANFHTLEEKR